MTKFEKKIQQFFERPTTLNYKEIEKILMSIGLEKIAAKGSHIKFKHNKLKSDLVIPIHNNDCKDYYKKLAAKIAQDIFNSQ